MRKAGFWKSDWFVGILVCGVMLALLNMSQWGQGLVDSLERKAYDFGVQSSKKTPLDKIAVIVIDDASIANIGRWAWPRSQLAKMTDLLSEGKPKLIANTVFFFEPQIDPGYEYIKRVQGALGEAPLDYLSFLPEFGKVKSILDEAEIKLNNDHALATSIGNAGNVLLPMFLTPGELHGRPDQALPEYIMKNRLEHVDASMGDAISGVAVQFPVEEIGSQAVAIGHLNSRPDSDGAIRAEPLVLRYYDQFFPSLSLMIAAKSLNLSVSDIQVKLGQEVQLGKLKIPVDAATQMNTFFYKDEGKPAFQVDSFFDVISGKIPVSKYQDKIVLIGGTAVGVGTPQVTPISPEMAPILTLAHSVSSILQEHFFVSPEWSGLASLGAFLFIALYLIILLPRLSAGVGAGVSALLLAALLITHYVLMTDKGIWIELMFPALVLVVGHILLTTKRFLVAERGKEKSDAESAESNRMLGLAFQGQGQLDMAFDKFRKCPLDDALMENLYNLALDFERKRQFNKAEAVFLYMSKFKPNFRDLEKRLKRVKAMSETVILSGGTGRTNSGTIILNENELEKPMLGRYQVEKELGKGAMGVVYLGRDPKINRIVAIKTLPLAQEFEEDELDDVKERFFREAETAGRLSHQNIVTMYDAGEEHDLAYIAMEFLKGKDLVGFTKAGNLLPLEKTVNIAAQIADALAYAHGHNVVHRDVKPANVMYDEESGQVKVTDFGIARITDSSKTKTGMVLGTPSYMSPEQLSGQKIDGRSDIFSLGVMLYQLLCGQLPFTGDSMAQLMYRIANEKYADIRSLNPEIPDTLAAVIDKALNKDIDLRYQSGEEMAQDLRACMQLFAGTESVSPKIDIDISL